MLFAQESADGEADSQMPVSGGVVPEKESRSLLQDRSRVSGAVIRDC